LITSRYYTSCGERSRIRGNPFMCSQRHPSLF